MKTSCQFKPEYVRLLLKHQTFLCKYRLSIVSHRTFINGWKLWLWWFMMEKHVTKILWWNETWFVLICQIPHFNRWCWRFGKGHCQFCSFFGNCFECHSWEKKRRLNYHHSSFFKKNNKLSSIIFLCTILIITRINCPEQQGAVVNLDSGL